MVLIPVLLVVLCSLGPRCLPADARLRDDNRNALTTLQLSSPGSIQSYERYEQVPRPCHVEAEDAAVLIRYSCLRNWPPLGQTLLNCW